MTLGKKAQFDYIWTDKKRTIFGLPISFTRYFITEKKIICRKGLFNIVEDEINIYKITDKKMTLPFFQRLFKCGTITIFSKDTDTREKDLVSIKNPYDVSKLIDKQLDSERDKYGIRGRDMMGEFDDQDTGSGN
ncbi:MAG: PH domain-containing protein [Ruminococcus sp.]|nr:PH domain-containing protein [Ruminococcus sp.]MBP1564469.1 PH domain-containing protein [Oscillospiraceae bacterium]